MVSYVSARNFRKCAIGAIEFWPKLERGRSARARRTSYLITAPEPNARAGAPPVGPNIIERLEAERKVSCQGFVGPTQAVAVQRQAAPLSDHKLPGSIPPTDQSPDEFLT
ncbi:hypothetical protein EVAR_51243_1 [Eumeta japonica]|uniref:Uncharacterized protein n=1 Tax=Eumeta variegata TaxID=151549 RepID=A0A4C1X0Y3_EUMVA|nr:hypothetical protein EVAR_51243_1 [Eumeta japonica]